MTDDTTTPSDPSPTSSLAPSLRVAIDALLAGTHRGARLIGLGEPTHGDDTFLVLRNRLLEHLIDHHQVRAVALETDADAARLLDAYVAGGTDDLEHALAAGFRHGFGRFPGNRDLLQWLRTLNADRPSSSRIRCVGFDAAMELTPEDYASAEHARRRIAQRTERMVDHLQTLLDSLPDGRILVFAHNTHLQRTPASMQLGERIEWDPVGAVLGARLGAAYVVVLGSGSALPARGVPAAPAGTLEHLLDTPDGTRLVDHDQLAAVIAGSAAPLRIRDDLTPAMALGPLDPATVVDAGDAVLHVPVGERGPLLSPERLRELIGALPDVAVDLAGRDTGAPEIAWGDTFFTVQPADDHDPRRMPFATVVTKDYPGFDDASELDRPGTFALNLGVGPQYFAGLLGFPPKQAAVHAGRFDPTATGILMPHPVYAAQGWVRVIDPPVAQEVQLIALAEAAAGRSRPRRDRLSGSDV